MFDFTRGVLVLGLRGGGSGGGQYRGKSYY